jgi:threonine dehydrogenase-like Zn-dependent dehydrogenase
VRVSDEDAQAQALGKDNITFHDPDFHRREITLLASRNSTAADFRRIIALIEAGKIDTRPWITHRASLGQVPELFPEWLAPDAGVVKAVVDVRRAAS